KYIMLNILRKISFFIILSGSVSISQAEPNGDTSQKAASDVKGLYRQWADIRYQQKSDKREAMFESLREEAELLTDAHPKDAELWIWRGIINSTYAGEVGGLSALSVIKEAKKNLKMALKLDATALSGSAYTSLGVLYYQVPGWPLSFGDDEEAEKLLKKGLAINPKGIDPNFFYADFLINQGRKKEAGSYLEIAENATDRNDRPVADKGRRAEIVELKGKL
ncbi:MAG: hypothetical protein KUG73_14405, partial [Pseudomonadales bacterium]|nr:hypothetical protein [Pseudomonadales bacterium]